MIYLVQFYLVNNTSAVNILTKIRSVVLHDVAHRQKSDRQIDKQTPSIT